MFEGSPLRCLSCGPSLVLSDLCTRQRRDQPGGGAVISQGAAPWSAMDNLLKCPAMARNWTWAMEKTDSEIHSFSHWAIITRATEKADSEIHSSPHWAIMFNRLTEWWNIIGFLLKKRRKVERYLRSDGRPNKPMIPQPVTEYEKWEGVEPRGRNRFTRLTATIQEGARFVCYMIYLLAFAFNVCDSTEDAACLMWP